MVVLWDIIIIITTVSHFKDIGTLQQLGRTAAGYLRQKPGEKPRREPRRRKKKIANSLPVTRKPKKNKGKIRKKEIKHKKKVRKKFTS